MDGMDGLSSQSPTGLAVAIPQNPSRVEFLVGSEKIKTSQTPTASGHLNGEAQTQQNTW
jgi:hypothetical protein